MEKSRRGVLRSIGAGTAAVVGTAGVVSASPTGAGPQSEGDKIVDVAVGDDRFEMLVAAVKEAGLVEALSGNRQFTVFAPKDEAFNDAGITVDNVDEVDDEFLLNVLTYHVTFGRRDAESVITSSEVPTLNGALIDVNNTNLNGDQADIVATNFEASNGIVHAIDGVLLP